MGVNGIYGLSGSGLDVESMVKVGMMSKQNQLTKMQQTYTKNEWKKDAYLEVYNKIQDYSTSTLSTYKLSSNMNARSATSSNPLIKATANASAPAMNHTITVESTATNAYLVGTEKISTGNSTKFNDLRIDGFNGGSLSFTISDGTGEGYTPAKYASSTFASDSDFFSANAKKFHNILQAAWDAESDALSVNDKTIDLKGVALTFSVDAGENYNNANIEITYGEIAELLNNKNATFQDLVDLLNEKMQDKNVQLTASYNSSAQSLTFTNNIAATDATVNVQMYDGGKGEFEKYILNDLANATNTSDENATSGIDNSDPDNISLYFENFDGGAPAELTGGTSINLTISEDTTYYDLISEINGKGTNIRMTYDSVQDKFSIYNMKTGSENSINIIANDDDTAAFFSALGLKDTRNASDLSNVDAFEFTANELKTAQGNDASVLIDGERYDKINANNLTVNGVTYNFGNVTEKTSAVVTVEQDVDKIVDNVKSFVESYNKLLGELDDMYRESPNSSYAPLTDAQKAEMTEEQIKKWEEKAKSGMLYHDPTLRKIIDQMRTAVTGPIESLNNTSYDRAYSIGISTKGLYGQIQVDEDKLRAALNDDSDSVYKVFATLKETTRTNNKNGTTTTVVDIDNSGIAQRLGQIIADSIENVTNISGKSKDNSDDSQLSTLLRNLQTKMSNFQSMMNAFEESLYKKYDAMESTLAMLGSQLNYVTGMFA